MLQQMKAETDCAWKKRPLFKNNWRPYCVESFPCHVCAKIICSWNLSLNIGWLLHLSNEFFFGQCYLQYMWKCVTILCFGLGYAKMCQYTQYILKTILCVFVKDKWMYTVFWLLYYFNNFLNSVIFVFYKRNGMICFLWFYYREMSFQ